MVAGSDRTTREAMFEEKQRNKSQPRRNGFPPGRNGFKSKEDEKLETAPEVFFEEFEETPLWVAVCTYFSYTILIIFGYLRDFMRNHGLERSKAPKEKGNEVCYKPVAPIAQLRRTNSARVWKRPYTMNSLESCLAL